MCGIIGIFHDTEAVNKVKKGIALLQKRGKDAVGIATANFLHTGKTVHDLTINNDIHASGHTLHSIVGFIPQPIKNTGILTANCEIYNWKELAEQYNFSHAKNDAELLSLFLDQFGIEKLQEFDGVYAFAYWKDNSVILVRDIVGVKPLWYAHENGTFAFASEKKVLKEIGYITVQELHPRQIIIYNIISKTITIKQREFFDYLPEHTDNYDHIKEKTRQLLHAAVEKRVPDKKFGLLFSGGVDSVFLAQLLKQKGHNFTCYTAVLDTDNAVPSDLIAAQEAAKQLGLHLKIKKVKLAEIPAYLKKIVPLIEDSHVVKVGVALTLYAACEIAQEDSCKVIFSGLGSEEIFAGYERHKHSPNVNQECLSGLRKVFERDLYRDDVITMDNNMEIRLPFLDKELVKYALKIPTKYKLSGETVKYILRDIALTEGLPQEMAFRKKTAAQYGSRFDYALGKLTREGGFTIKSAYLKQFYPFPNLKLGILFSSGKDSTYAAYIMQRQNYELSCLIHLKSRNKNSYMFQTAGTELAELQAEAMDLPIIIQDTAGEKEAELQDLEEALKKAKQHYQIDGIVSGALFSTYQRDRIEAICEKLGLKVFTPLWHKEQEQQMLELQNNGFTFILTAIAAEGLDKSWLNKIITGGDIQKLLSLKTKISVAGEGGEFESLVLDCPLFKKKIVINSTEIIEENKNAAYLVVTQAGLEEK